MITAELRIPVDLASALRAYITQAEEWAGYLLCGVLETPDRLVLLGRIRSAASTNRALSSRAFRHFGWSRRTPSRQPGTGGRLPAAHERAQPIAGSSERAIRPEPPRRPRVVGKRLPSLEQVVHDPKTVW